MLLMQARCLTGIVSLLSCNSLFPHDLTENTLFTDFSGRLAIAVLYRMAFGLDPGTITSSPSCLDTQDMLLNSMHTCNTTSSG